MSSYTKAKLKFQLELAKAKNQGTTALVAAIESASYYMVNETPLMPACLWQEKCLDQARQALINAEAILDDMDDDEGYGK